MHYRLSVFARAILLLACGSVAACSSDGQRDAPLRIGLNVWPGYEFLYLASEKGFFREAGVEVRLIEFSSLSDARRSYERGQLDGLACTIAELVQAAQQSSRAPRAVLVADYSVGGDVLLAKEGIDSMSALRGKRIGLELGSVGVYMLARALESADMSIEDVEVVPMDQLSMGRAMVEGELDAVVTYPPASLKLQAQAPLKKLFSSAQIPGEVLDIVAVEGDVIDRRPAEVAALARAYFRAVEYAAQHPAEAYALMGAREGLSGEEFAAALADGIVLVPEAEQSK